MVSIVMTAYKRAQQLLNTLASIVKQKADPEVIVVEDGDDGGETRGVCERYGAKYIQRAGRPENVWSNPSVPTNMGLRAATGDIVILQNAEVMHTGDLINELSNRVDDYSAVFPSVMSLKEDGANDRWYVHGENRTVPFFFCGAMKRKWFTELRGLDEDFKLCGFDDNDFATRLSRAGVRFEYHDDLLAIHQWHPALCWSVPQEDKLCKRKIAMMETGEIGVTRNLYHEWGIG